MKKELKKMTAFASAVILASQCMTVIGAEEVKDERADIDQGIHDSILKTIRPLTKTRTALFRKRNLKKYFL